MGQISVRPVVTAFLLRRGRDEPRVFAVRRSERVGTYRGRWSAISGFLEDEPETQACREIQEETGLGPEDLRLLARGGVVTVEDAALAARWLVHPFLFEITGRREPALDWENIEGRWVTPAELGEMDTVPGLLDALARVLPPAMAGWPPVVADAVERLRADRSSGARSLALAAARALLEVVEAGADARRAAAALSLARPSMAPVGVALRRLLDLRPSRRGLAVLETEWDLAQASVAEYAAQVLPARVLTLSSGSTVTEALLARRPDLVVVAESRPLLEGRSTAAALAEEGLPVEVTADAAIPFALADVDALLLGADTLLAGGSAVNKTGSLAAALAARDAGRPVYVASELSKTAARTWFVVEEMAGEEVWPEAPGGVRVRNPYFERIPAELIQGIITEAGLLSPVELAERIGSPSRP